ncbi:exosortase N [Chitinophaga vietnamensis]|uniref:exosortase N n=1 Tax=Chitinophaga vietnamensis TaxID=2593957 RepID=UPI001177D462|nr:exosortase N [Chitinophaga vietnamensis]
MITLMYIRYRMITGGLLIVLYAIMMIQRLSDYFQWRSAAFALGMLTVAVVWRVERQSAGSFRFGWISAICLLLAFLLPVYTLQYAALVTGLFFIVETFFGRIDKLLILAALFIAPVMEYAANVFSFPVRLWLTAVAGKMISWTDPQVHTAGNLIIRGDREFAVDPACMGLQLTITSLLCCLMAVAIYQRRCQRSLPWMPLLALIGVVLLLDLVANLCRIIVLVMFALPPGTMAHEFVGLVSLGIYTIAPMAFLVKCLLYRYGKPPVTQTYARRSRQWWLLCLAPATILLPKKLTEKSNMKTFSLPGYESTQLTTGITRLYSQEALIYIKPIPGFYFTDHQPMICWKGSGFECRQMQQDNIDGVDVYTGILQRNKERLYTAWWYENGFHRSISQLEWRWDALRSGRHYYLVNITTASETLLREKVHDFLHICRIPTASHTPQYSPRTSYYPLP